MKSQNKDSHDGSSFEQYLEKQGKSTATIQYYKTQVLSFLAFLDRDNTEPENATAKEVLAYLSHLQRKGNQNSTRNIHLGVIKHFFVYQLAQNRRVDNPIKQLKIRGATVQKLYPVLSTLELEALYHDYKVPTDQDENKKFNWFEHSKLSKARNKVILGLFIHQGITTSEVERLEIGDLKLKDGQIYIAGSRKSAERTIDLKAQQIMELMEYVYQTRPLFVKHQLHENTKRLFLSLPKPGTNHAADKLEIWKSFTKELQKQHPKFINFKQLRTSVITHWLKLYNLREVQNRAGHKYVSSTERYLVNQIEELQTDIDNFHPF